MAVHFPAQVKNMALVWFEAGLIGIHRLVVITTAPGRAVMFK